MKLRSYVRLWAILTLLMSIEFFLLSKAPPYSLLQNLKLHHFLPQTLDLSVDPGRTLSWWSGWIGFGTMCLTNLYSLRKRVEKFRHLGRLANWLDFHIFCGLMGPTLILFHTDFKVGGVVAISFWCMVISFLSGIVGRYFYLQLGNRKHTLERKAKIWEARVRLAEIGQPPEIAQLALARVLFTAGAVQLAGTGAPFLLARAASGADGVSIPASVLNSIRGDLRLRLGFLGIGLALPSGVSRDLRRALVHYAVTCRRLLYLGQFRKIMGYWHAFHMPFAVFMYVVAIIHIISELVLAV
jgi:hypothetical protein